MPCGLKRFQRTGCVLDPSPALVHFESLCPHNIEVSRVRLDDAIEPLVRAHRDEGPGIFDPGGRLRRSPRSMALEEKKRQVSPQHAGLGADGGLPSSLEERREQTELAVRR